MTEKAIKESFNRWSKKQDDLLTFHYSAYMGVTGIADRIGYLQNSPAAIPFWIEFKRPGKNLTVLQKARKKEYEAIGVYVLGPCYSLKEAQGFIERLRGIKEQINKIIKRGLNNNEKKTIKKQFTSSATE